MRTCQTSGCERPVAAQGYCHTHYRRARYQGLTKIQEHGTKGGGSLHNKGYRQYGHEQEHILIAVRALGKPLPPQAVVHHVDENKANNDPSNLVICPNQSYHALLHQRMDAYKACGNPEAKKCRYCNEWGDPMKDNMYISYGSNHHRSCRNAQERMARK